MKISKKLFPKPEKIDWNKYITPICQDNTTLKNGVTIADFKPLNKKTT